MKIICVSFHLNKWVKITDVINYTFPNGSSFLGSNSDIPSTTPRDLFCPLKEEDGWLSFIKTKRKSSVTTKSKSCSYYMWTQARVSLLFNTWQSWYSTVSYFSSNASYKVFVDIVSTPNEFWPGRRVELTNVLFWLVEIDCWRVWMYGNISIIIKIG